MPKTLEYVTNVAKNMKNQITSNGVADPINLNTMAKCGGAVANTRKMQKGVK